MSKIDINSDQWCDLVFENRNTEFGAFVLRKDSYRRHLKALIIATIVFLLAIAAPILVKSISEKMKKAEDTARVIDYIDPDKGKVKEEIKPEIEAPKVPERNQIIYLPPVITPDKDVAENEEIKSTLEVIENKSAIGNTTVTGGTDDPNVVPITTQTVITEAPKVEEIVDVPQVPAQFPGGMSTLYEYLGSAMQYPASAREAGIQGKVIVGFVVGKDGRITDVKILRSVDPALDDEAIRVVKGMPAWSPGKQNDSPVRSRMTLPVIFKLNQ
jgi:periplasmic protein TonB